MANVLVVDDEPDIVLFAQINLEMLGHTVRTAGDGREALAAVHEARPDVVVLDVMMPHLDGWGVLEQLKSDPDEAIRTIPVVMLTALDTEPDQLRGGIEGAVRYLAKPITPDDLTDAVQGVLDGGPEPAQRKAVQQRSLTRLARIESGTTGKPEEPRVQLSRLERPLRAGPVDRPVAAAPAVSIEADLTAKQRELLKALFSASSVSDAATTLGMSRSNIYASLRRIGRKLDVPDVSALLRLLRSGALASSLEP